VLVVIALPDCGTRPPSQMGAEPFQGRISDFREYILNFGVKKMDILSPLDIKAENHYFCGAVISLEKENSAFGRCAARDDSV
jgi:hypothetical protein